MEFFLNLINKVQAALPSPSLSENDLRNATDVGDFISKLYPWAIGFGVGLASLVMIYAGYIYVTSQGNPDSTKTAKDLIVGALVGLALIILAGMILRSVVGIPEVAPT